MRATAIVLCQFLTGKVSSEIHTLLDSIVRIPGISYLSEQKCTPRTVLQLYNLTLYHRELLQHLKPALAILTRSKLFGSYLHDISYRAAPQFELVSLRSCNTEFEERLFGQANQVAQCCTNRQPDNVLQQMFIWLQVLLSVKQTKVSRAAKGLGSYNGTIIPKSFVRSRMHSWEVHLKRIAPYLSKGEGVWWEQNSGAYYFFDGEQHVDVHPEGPQQLHCRSTSRKQLDAIKKESWNTILASGTTLPTENIQHYDEDGMPTHKTYFSLTATASSSKQTPPSSALFHITG